MGSPEVAVENAVSIPAVPAFIEDDALLVAGIMFGLGNGVDRSHERRDRAPIGEKPEREEEGPAKRPAQRKSPNGLHPSKQGHGSKGRDIETTGQKDDSGSGGGSW